MSQITITMRRKQSQREQRVPRGQTRGRGIGAVRGLLLAELALLVPQFVLGMYINLFVAFPGTLRGSSAWRWALAQLPIQLHIDLGTVLVLLAVVTFGLAIATKRGAAITWSGIGLAMLLLAWLSGDFFLVEGQPNVRSFTMALGFLGAFSAYAVGYSLTRKHAS